MRVVFFEIEDFEQPYLAQKLNGHELIFSAERLTADTAHLAREAEVVSIFVYSQVDRQVLAQLPQLKLLTTRSMGFNHIDTKACRAGGISVAYVPSYGERTVAEHTFALILTLSRKIFTAHQRIEKGIFDYRGLQGFDLFGKTLGLVGGGKIGLNVARIARGFGMNVLVSDPLPKPTAAQEIGFTYVSLEELLAQSDIVSLHAPYSQTNHHLINAAKFRLMRPGSLLINTARGGLVDTQALLQALENGTLAGAGLDVLEEECAIREERELMSKSLPPSCDLGTVVRDHILINRDDVIITPHIAFNSREAVERIMDTTVENIKGWAAGKPINLVPQA
ncbi:MAG: hydroxyacid dehydrogenase [Candidatus Kerfeldbacteria bacterium]|nr:hydroxyacid dehydrogenase [Candidatus Kerfeldbacteria bacterium]